MVIPTAAAVELPAELSAPASADPYVLGLYVAEGCLVKEYKDIHSRGTYGRVLYTLSTKDDASIEYLQAWYARQGRDPVAVQPSYTSEYGVRLTYGLRELAQYVDAAFGHLAETKHIHPSVFGWSVSDRLRFLAGYFDGDGCVDRSGTKYAGTLKASTASRSLALDMQRLCASVGVAMSVSRCFNYERHRHCAGFGKGGGDRVIYSMCVGSSQSNLILSGCLRLCPHSHGSKYGGPSLQTSGKYALVRVAEVLFDEVVDDVRYNLEVAEDNSYLVDVQGHNSNRNGDIFFGHGRCVEFPEPKGAKSAQLDVGNADQIWTWTKYAKVYRDHRNKKTDKSYGDVLKAAHNAKMARTELLVDVPNDDPVWRDDIEKMANGESTPWSMSCKVDGDLCSICGNFSKSRKAKDGGTDCRHIKHQLSCLSKSGHRVGMINDHMVFFDISRVRVPADRIAYSLLKVAGLGGGADMDDERSLHVFNVPRISGEDDPLGLYASKLSEVLHKLSNIEKQIEAVGRAPNESLSFDPSVMRHLSDDERAAMGQSRGDIGKVLAALADKKICLSLPDFVKLILGERAGGYENSIRLASDSLPGVFSRLAEEDDDDELPESAMDEGEAAVPRRVSEMIEAMKGGMSLDDEPVARRVTIVAIRKLPAPDLKKAASVYDETADKMLRAYAAYKVAWCLRNGIDSRVTKLAVLQHYVGSN